MSASPTPLYQFLGHPVGTGAISQVWGGNAADYAPMSGHNGIDIDCPVGTPVHLNVEGLVDDGTAANAIAVCVFRGILPGLGRTVIVHVDDPRVWPGGYLLLYGHLSVARCVAGIGVANGMEIGLSGGRPGASGAGRSTGPHLHFGLSPCRHNPVPAGELHADGTPKTSVHVGSMPRIDWRDAQLDRTPEYWGWIDPQGFITPDFPVRSWAADDWGEPEAPQVLPETNPAISDPDRPTTDTNQVTRSHDLVARPKATRRWLGQGLLEASDDDNWLQGLTKVAVATAWKRIVLPGLLAWLAMQHPATQDIVCSLSQGLLCVPEQTSPDSRELPAIPSADVAPAQLPLRADPPGQTGTVAGPLNVRACGSTDCSVVNILPDGTVVGITATAGDWLEIAPGSWVHGRYVDLGARG